MTGKAVLVAHRQAAVRDRFAAALAGAGHRVTQAASAAALREALQAHDEPMALALVDADLLEEAGVAALTAAGVPFAMFAGTVGTAAGARRWAEAGARAWINDHSAPHQIVPSLAPVLYRDNFDRRTTPRVPVALPVSCRLEGGVTPATAVNIGGGGLGLRPLTPVPAGTALVVGFRLPSAAREIQVAARVVWTDVRAGIGVQFERVNAADQQAIDAFVEEHLGGAGTEGAE
jgi:hypothetical protein